MHPKIKTEININDLHARKLNEEPNDYTITAVYHGDSELDKVVFTTDTFKKRQLPELLRVIQSLIELS